MDEVKQMVDGFSSFLEGADIVLRQLRTGGLSPGTRQVAEEIKRVEQQIRIVEQAMAEVRKYVVP